MYCIYFSKYLIPPRFSKNRWSPSYTNCFREWKKKNNPLPRTIFPNKSHARNPCLRLCSQWNLSSDLPGEDDPGRAEHTHTRIPTHMCKHMYTQAHSKHTQTSTSAPHVRAHTFTHNHTHAGTATRVHKCIRNTYTLMHLHTCGCTHT